MKLYPSLVIAVAQISLSVIFLVGYFILLGLFLTGTVRTPIEWKDQLTALLGVLTAGVVTVVQFWFGRTREKDSTDDTRGFKKLDADSDYPVY